MNQPPKASPFARDEMRRLSSDETKHKYVENGRSLHLYDIQKVFCAGPPLLAQSAVKGNLQRLPPLQHVGSQWRARRHRTPAAAGCAWQGCAWSRLHRRSKIAWRGKERVVRPAP